jgi:hypothetical protein
MLCFRDRSFCASDCTNTACPKHFGEDDKLAAKEWARRIGFDEGEVPVSFSDLSKGCPEYRKPEKP